jgi:hypothetical protein
MEEARQKDNKINQNQGAEPDEPVADVAVSREEPVNLFSIHNEQHEFPVNALPGSIRSAVIAISEKCQVPASLAAQSVLATVCLATQAHADVFLPFGQKRPCSLFFMSIAGSGDRKTTSDNEAMRGVAEYEEGLSKSYREQLEVWKLACSNWESGLREIKRNRELADSDRNQKLKQLGSRPAAPLAPFISLSDSTFEGLIKNWDSALRPSLGIFSAEGGQFTGGYGMTPEAKLRSGASASELWDGRSVRRVRAGDGLMFISGRRLSMHLMIQVKAAAEFLSDPVLRDQGLLSRFLIAAPRSLAGQRLSREIQPGWQDAISHFAIRIKKILNHPLPLKKETRNELTPRTVPLSASAETIFYELSDEVEKNLGPLGRYATISEIACKAAENAARLALCIALFDQLDVSEVSAEHMEAATILAQWYLNEAILLSESFQFHGAIADAENLRVWLIGSGYEAISKREIMRFGPSRFRSSDRLQPLLNVLCEHGWLTPVANRKGHFQINQPSDTATSATN